MEEELIQSFQAEIKDLIMYEVHAYMRELLGDAVFILLSTIFILLGLVLFIASVSNSNLLFGDPNKRDRSQLGDLEYLKTRRILRVIVGLIGFILVVYNILGLSA